MTGDPVPGMKRFARTISDLLTRWQVPAAAVAVVTDGRLVYARGFGYADVDAANALLTLEGSAETLGLVDGPNVVRLVDGTGRLSNGFAVLVPVIPDAGVQPDRTIALAFDPPGSVPSGRGPSC